MKAYRLIYIGKTKDTFSTKNNPDLLIMRFKDNVLGKDGMPDSGGNEVIGVLHGKGRACARINSSFMRLFAGHGIRTHFVDTLPQADVVVCRTERIPIEFICRNLAYGTYLERHPGARPFAPLGGIIEYSLKSDEAGDPFMTKQQVLDFVSRAQLHAITAVIRRINAAVSSFCGKASVVLVDFKAEFGKLGRRTVMIDDFSCDTARFAKNGKLLSPFELEKIESKIKT
jgi:phosphoribosylaminoimidazole-succinocarboxamide synthase